MAKPTLLISRFAPRTVKLICENEAVRERFRIICVAQQPVADFDICWPNLESAFEDRMINDDPARVRNYYEPLIKGWDVEVVINVQKLFWYSEVVANVCSDTGVSCIWGEGFLDDRICLDRIGAQYTERNDIQAFVNYVAVDEPKIPTTTRWAQPVDVSRDHLLQRYGLTGDEICVFGQTDFDNAVKEHGELGYYEWLNALFVLNPGTKFVFKHHPFAPSKNVASYQNVIVVNESVDSLLRTFNKIATFSSTTALEAIFRGKSVLTGGFHFLSGSGLTIEARTPADLHQVSQRLAGHLIDIGVRRRWLSFLCNRYAIDPRSPQLLARLTRPSEVYFREW